MKRCFITGLIATLILGAMPVYAAAYESNQYVTLEEYSAAIEAEYAEYGIEGGVFEPEGEFLCTHETLQSDLAIVKEYCENYVKRQQMPIMVEPETEPSISSRVMRGTVTMTDSYIYFDTSVPVMPLWCKIETTVDIVVDYQGAYIVYANTPTLEVTEALGFDDWIEYVSHSTTIDQENHRVTMDITCKVKEEVSLGAVTSWAKIDITYPAVYNDVPC